MATSRVRCTMVEVGCDHATGAEALQPPTTCSLGPTPFIAQLGRSLSFASGTGRFFAILGKRVVPPRIAGGSVGAVPHDAVRPIRVACSMARTRGPTKVSRCDLTGFAGGVLLRRAAGWRGKFERPTPGFRRDLRGNEERPGDAQQVILAGRVRARLPRPRPASAWLGSGAAAPSSWRNFAAEFLDRHAARIVPIARQQHLVELRQQAAPSFPRTTFVLRRGENQDSRLRAKALVERLQKRRDRGLVMRSVEDHGRPPADNFDPGWGLGRCQPAAHVPGSSICQPPSRVG